jgi:hypothetical protein
VGQIIRGKPYEKHTFANECKRDNAECEQTKRRYLLGGGGDGEEQVWSGRIAEQWEDL